MIINMTKFYKFNEYIVVDRAIAMLHVYSRRNIQSGRFMYIKRKKLEALWRDYRFSKRRNYRKHCSKDIRGMFPDILNPKYKYNVLKDFNNAAYEKEKDAAIMSIGAGEVKLTPAQQRKLFVKEFIKNKIDKGEKVDTKQLSEDFNISTRSIQMYTKEIRETKFEKTQ